MISARTTRTASNEGSRASFEKNDIAFFLLTQSIAFSPTGSDP